MSYWFDSIKNNQDTIACPSCTDNLKSEIFVPDLKDSVYHMKDGTKEITILWNDITMQNYEFYFQEFIFLILSNSFKKDHHAM